MVYNDEFKEEVFKAVASGMTFKEVAQRFHIARHSIYNWLKKDPEKYNHIKRKKLKYTPKEKLDIIKLVEEDDKSIRDVALETGLATDTIQTWIKDKRHIYALYYTWETATNEKRDSFYEEKHDMDPEDKARDEHLKNKALKEENQYLKAKVKYLEKLMELNGTPAPDFKKKQDVEPSKKLPKAKE